MLGYYYISHRLLAVKSYAWLRSNLTLRTLKKNFGIWDTQTDRQRYVHKLGIRCGGIFTTFTLLCAGFKNL